MLRSGISKVCKYKRAIIIIGTPLILSPLIFAVKGAAARCGYILLLMAIFWLTEAIPLGVTALIPVILVPMMGIQTADQISSVYLKDTNMLFIGGLLVAMAVEYQNLHKRLALLLLMQIPTHPRWLLLGFMLPTWFMSMWINNTAATAMMLPIVDAVLQVITKQDGGESKIELDKLQSAASTAALTMNIEENRPYGTYELEIEVTEDEKKKEKSRETENLEVATVLSVAYAATCGGIATLTGTAPNLVLYSNLNREYDGKAGINFGTWMVYGFPISVLCGISCWLWLLVFYFGPRKAFGKMEKNDSENNEVKSMIRREYQKLGPVSFAEGSTAIMLICLVLLWVTREPNVNGWTAFFIYNGVKYCSDATPAILITILLIIWPAKRPFSSSTSSKLAPQNEKKGSTLLPWKHVQKNFPLEVVLLIGGGLALAQACDKSGLSKVLGESLLFVEHLPRFLLVVLVCACAAALTEITSNTAVISIAAPIFMSLAHCLEINPLLLLLPLTLSSSFAFCLPVATPPNALAFGTGKVSVKNMAKTGLMLNFLALCIVIIATYSYANLFFDLMTTPSWTKPCNRANETINN